MTPTESEPRQPFWGYFDLLLFVGLMMPALGLALLAAQGAGALFHLSKPIKLLLLQLLWYILLAALLGAIFRYRYGRGFWSSLAWNMQFRGLAACIFGGPLLAFAIGAVGYLIHAPIVKLPMFDEMLSDRLTIALFSVFVVALGPLCEELAFRGFLMPLLIRTFGVVGGIVTTAVLFGGLHASEYDWSWRHVLLIAIVGGVLGW